MSLTDEAVQAISEFRNNTFTAPANLDEYNKNLQTKLTEIGRRDNNIFYAVRPEYFNHFPAGEQFDAEEYITFRYLFESSYNVRRALVRQKSQQLEHAAENLIGEHPELAAEYESKYNSFNAESMGSRAGLKIEAKLNGIKSSRNWFAIKKISESPESFSVENLHDWIIPGQYKSELHQEFKRSSKDLGLSWGMSPAAIDYFINHIERKKTTEKVAIVSGVAAGAVLVAWGLTRAASSAAHSSSALAGAGTIAAAALPAIALDPGMEFTSQPLYGLENYPQFMVAPTNYLNANQGAFLNHLQNPHATNAYDLQIAILNNETSRMNSMQQAVTSALNPQVDYSGTAGLGFRGIGDAALHSLGNVFSGAPSHLLGAPTSLTLNNINNDLATITGRIGGQLVNTSIQRIGDMINFTVR